MPLYTLDLSTCTLAEVIQQQTDNVACSKKIRRENGYLVASRLANDISHAEYQSSRKSIANDAAECRHQAALLHARRVELHERESNSPLTERQGLVSRSLIARIVD